ncbi:MAG: PAS domain-containing protein, partial [Gemmatimonadetes bacterium]|nr:PAS domain-containing protein [Gemmatimonadota bacterium]
VRDTSTELLFRPNLYSSPEGALLFAGLSALVGAFVLAVAVAFNLVSPRHGGSAGADGIQRVAWRVALAIFLLLALGTAGHLTRAGAGASSAGLMLGMLAMLLAAGFALSGLAREPALAPRGWTRAVLWPAVLVGIASGATVVTGYAGGRVGGLRQLMTERLEEVGLPSNQWLEYNLRVTGERLSGAGAHLDRSEAEESAAFVGWSLTPMRDLPFPSALLVTDHEGVVRSRFSLLPPGDLELLPRIARAGLRSPAGQVGRVQTESGRQLFFTRVPLALNEAGGTHAVAVISEALEPSVAEESAPYFVRDIFFADRSDPLRFAVRRGEPEAADDRSLTVVSGSGSERLWISVPLQPYLPEALDYLSLCLAALAGAFALLVAYNGGLADAPIPWPRGWANPLATFRGRIFAVLLAFVAVPITVYSWASFQTTRHEIDQATRAVAEEALRPAAAFLGPRLEAGGSAELEAALPEAARVIGQDLIVYRNGAALASNRPELFQANLFSPRVPGAVYRQLVFGGERLALQRARIGRKQVLVAFLKVPVGGAQPPYILASPLLLRPDHILQNQRELLQVLFVLFALSLLALGFFSWLVSRQLSSPLSVLKEGADRIARGELSHRLRDPERSDEFGRLFSAFNTMAAGLQVSQGELVSEKSRMEAILSSIGAGVIALDRDGRLQLANQAAHELLGLPRGIVGRRYAELPTSPFWDRASRALKLGQRREEEVQLATNGTARTLHLTLAPLVGEGGERRGLVVVFEDLSHVLASQRSQAWEEMARQVAHEIKNPLTPIKLSLQHLQRVERESPADLKPMLGRSLDLVLSEIGRLERIAGEFSRFGAAEPEAGSLDLMDVTREVVDLYAQGDGDVRVLLDARGEPAHVSAERDGLKKVLVNLLENAREAMHETGAGGGTIQVELDFQAREDCARVRVRDEGPGIPAEDLERLFQPYFSTKTRGTGLGLAIARRIVRAWGGSISAGNWERGAEVLLSLEKSGVRPLDTQPPGG